MYALRTQIEERHRQTKNFWYINKFTSLNKNHLNAIANKTIQSLKGEEQMGINNVIVYSGNYFAVFDLDDYTEVIVDLEDEARLRLQKWIKAFKQQGKLRGS